MTVGDLNEIVSHCYLQECLPVAVSEISGACVSAHMIGEPYFWGYAYLK